MGQMLKGKKQNIIGLVMGRNNKMATDRSLLQAFADSSEVRSLWGT
jgi:hypothetical protein